MSFFSRASLHHPPPPSRASSSTAVEDDIKRPSLPPLEPSENKLSRKLKRKPAPQLDENDQNVPAKWAEGGAGKDEAAPTPADQSPAATIHKTNGQEKKNIMRRVSSIFKGKSKTSPSLNLAGKTAPSAWGNRGAIGTMYIAEEGHGSGAYESDMETCESEDDIRRPSGLGSAVSLMIPPSPSWLRLSNQVLGPKSCEPTESEEDARSTTEDGTYPRSRATSTPNLLRSITVKAKDKIRKGVQVARRASQSYSRAQEIAAVTGTFSSLPPIPKAPKLPQFPIELLDLVLPHLPRDMIATLCSLSKSFNHVGRPKLYEQLELDSLTPAKLQRLLATLASKRDLPDLVHECICHTWPTFFATPQNEANVDEEDQLRNTLLTATFTLAFQRMSNLGKLTLPAFDASLLAQHTAFGLRSLTFMCSQMSNEEMGSLFTWLDGQTNVKVLKFPNLEDSPSSSGNPDHPQYLRLPCDTAGSSTPPRSSPFMATGSLPRALESGRAMSPSSSTSAFRRSLFVSPTLLPALTTLHATPAILSLLEPSSYIPGDASHLDLSSIRGASSEIRRPLREVHLNIGTTLYTGLRPNAVMANLKSAGVRALGIRFGEEVDKRTVEKCLIAAGSILGSSEKEGDEENGEERDERWKGLEELVVSFKSEGLLAPGIEETLYKTIQSSLPRYSALRKLTLNFHRPPTALASPTFGPTVRFSPAPSSPLPPPENWEVTLKLKGEKSIENLSVFKFPAPPPSVPVTPNLNRLSVVMPSGQPISPSRLSMTLDGLSVGKRKSSPVDTLPAFTVHPAKDGVDMEEGDLEKWNERDWARVQAWASTCPSLRRVDLAGVGWECKASQLPPSSSPPLAPEANPPSEEHVRAEAVDIVAEKPNAAPIPGPIDDPQRTHKAVPSLPPPLPPKDHPVSLPSPVSSPPTRALPLALSPSASGSVPFPSRSPIAPMHSPPPPAIDANDPEAKAKERKRIESMRILARISARNQRWVPRDAEPDEEEEDSSDESEAAKKEIAVPEYPIDTQKAKAKAAPYLEPELPTPKKADTPLPESSKANGHGYTPSFGSRVATEGSISMASTDFGTNFTSRFGDGFLQESQDEVAWEEGQSEELGFASSPFRADFEAGNGGVIVGNLRLTRYIESDSEDSETEESIGVPFNWSA